MSDKGMPVSVKSRRLVLEGSDVFVWEKTLDPGESMPFHYHSHVADIFYCLQGNLSIDQIDIFSNQCLPTLQVPVGSSVKIDTNVAHRPHNSSDSEIKFLLIQGVGEYDYILYNKV